MANDSAPLAGLRVVEVALGLSTVGAGMASSLRGAILRDLGADVLRVQSRESFTLDEGVEYARAWNHGKEVLEVEREEAASRVSELVGDADVLLVAGPEDLVERRGLTYRALATQHPRLVQGRIRPSFHAGGSIADIELLVHARSGFGTQMRGHRPGPIFFDLAVGNAGASLAITAGVLATLYEREATGVGGWVESSLYDGLFVILPMGVGRVEIPSPGTRALWGGLGPSIALSFQCADGEWLQLWFGAKGAYDQFLAYIGDPPSEQGYAADTASGLIGEHSKRWQKELFSERDRTSMLEWLAGHNFRAEPVLRPGEALLDQHAREIGLSVEVEDPERGRISVLGPVGRVTPVPVGGSTAGGSAEAVRLLKGLRVLDLSAYLAGPVTPLVLAELGADVIKVEPGTGDVHRIQEAMFAAGQRGKRVLALDLKSPDAPEVLQRLFRWAEVVHHNSRIGLAERLGYDEPTVRAVNPGVVYCHASGFGDHGPRHLLAANDHLMQALSGVEAATGGLGNGPSFVPFGSIDVTGGWMAACATLAALYAQRRTGVPQTVHSTLLGSGMTLKSGSFVANGAVVEGPVLDANQTGWGATYRIYEGSDGGWFALAVLDADMWSRVRDVVGVEGLPERPPALRTSGGDPQPAETVLEAAFATRPASEWVAALRGAEVAVEAVPDIDRPTFCSWMLDDPVNRQLGRVASFDWPPRGVIHQPGMPVRLGPEPKPQAPQQIPQLGEHTDEVLAMVGFDDVERAKLFASGTVNTELP